MYFLGKELNGVISASGTKDITAETQCNNDQFVVTSPGNPTPPVICGTNTNEHSNFIQ